MAKALIIDLKLNNIGSVIESFKKIDVECITKLTKKNIDSADILVLPGVGSFPAGMKYIKKNKIDKIIKKFSKSKQKKIVGICLGMQLLFEKSNELGVTTRGLSLIKGKVVNLNTKLKPNNKSLIPNIGWHQINVKNRDKLFYRKINKQKYYFIHSYCVETKYSKDISSYIKLDGKKIISSVQRENIFGFQFHPEKSGKKGGFLLKSLVSSFDK